MSIATRLIMPLAGLASAALAQPAFVPPPDAAYAADPGPMIAAPPNPGNMNQAAVTQAAQPGDRFGFQNVGDVAVFQPALEPHGRWVNSQWGNAFLPDAPNDWRPYQNGRWGPDRFWQSDDPWGWATDHYGRWGFDQNVGWVWVPGTEWAPSWTAWREDDDVVGWAPIPPQVNYRRDVGFGNDWRWNDWNSWYAPSWVWVPRGQLYGGGFRGRTLPWNNGARFWRGSRWNWGGGLAWNDWGRRGGTSISIGFGNGWNNGGWNNGGWNSWGGNNWGWNNWGGNNWNQPWGWNNWGWNNWGWNNGFGWGWNNRGWNNRGGWGGRDRRPDRNWDRGDNRGDNRGDGRGWRGNDPRRGAPGSVGDYIGRGLNGSPPPAGVGVGRRGDGQWGNGRRGNGDRGRGFDGPRGGVPDAMPNRPMRNEAYNQPQARPDGGGMGARIGRAMAPESAPAPRADPNTSRRTDPDRNTRPQ